MNEIKERVVMGNGDKTLAEVGLCYQMLSRAFQILSVFECIEMGSEEYYDSEGELQSIAEQLYIALTGVKPLVPAKKEEKPLDNTKKPPIFDGFIYVVMYWNGRRWMIKDAHSDVVHGSKSLEDVQQSHDFCMLVKTNVCEIVANWNGDLEDEDDE